MKRKPLSPVPSDPVTETTFWLELDEAEVTALSQGTVPARVQKSAASFLRMLESPAAAIAEMRQTELR